MKTIEEKDQGRDMATERRKQRDANYREVVCVLERVCERGWVYEVRDQDEEEDKV